MDEYPEKGELVVANVEQVTGYGAFVRLEEYGNKQGIVNIRDFSLKWVKNPRDYFKEGQKTVLKVLRINKERGHIDLSLRNVNEAERKNKLRDFKMGKRVEQMMLILAERIGKPLGELESKLNEPLLDEYESIYDAFLAVSAGREDLSKYVKDPKEREEIVKFISESIKPPEVTINSYFSIKSEDSNGVSLIRDAIKTGESALNDANAEISYISSPIYRVDVTSEDYKTAEAAMKECMDAIDKYARTQSMDFMQSRDRKELLEN
jgi:translation initiation factor 2 subunit 1